MWSQQTPTIYGNPLATLLAGRRAWRAGGDLTLYRFAWADPATGLVTNAYAEGCFLGFALPTYRMWDWNRVYLRGIESVLRAGMMVVLAAQGDFYTRFPLGAAALSPVYVNPADGTASIYQDEGFLATPYTCMQGGGCNRTARISSWPTFGSH